MSVCVRVCDIIMAISENMQQLKDHRINQCCMEEA